MEVFIIYALAAVVLLDAGLVVLNHFLACRLAALEKQFVEAMRQRALEQQERYLADTFPVPPTPDHVLAILALQNSLKK